MNRYEIPDECSATAEHLETHMVCARHSLWVNDVDHCLHDLNMIMQIWFNMQDEPPWDVDVPPTFLEETNEK